MKNLSFCAFIAILLLLLFAVYGCGGNRNTGKEYYEISSNYLFNDKSYTLSQNTQLNDIGELNPIDITKPFVVDGKEYFNVSIKFDKSKFKDFELNKKEIGTVTGTSEIKDNKQTEKSDNTILWVLITLIVCGFVFLWFYLPKLKTGI